jgi:hypothetical protein
MGEVQEHERRPLESPVAKARRTDPQTSHDAAKSVQKISELKFEILAAFRTQGPMRDDELVKYIRDKRKLKVSDSSIRSRRNELTRDDKLLEPLMCMGNQVTTEMATHRAGKVWKIIGNNKTSATS